MRLQADPMMTDNGTYGHPLRNAPPKYKAMAERVIAGKGASPRTAIKVMCVMCMGWQAHLVKDCTSRACPLYRHRPGAAK